MVLCKCQSSTRDLLTIIFLVNILTTFWCIQQTVFFVSSIEMKYDRHDQISELKQISIDCRGLWGSSNDLFALNWVSIFAKFCQDRNDTRTLLYHIQEDNKTQLIT